MADIFEEYDIRGAYPEDINEREIKKIIPIFKAYLNLGPKDRVVLGRDKRKSSPGLADTVSKELTKLGLDVIDIGETKTPVFYFAVNFLNAKGGLMITASHNPQNYNGMKMVAERSVPVGGLELKQFKEKYSAEESSVKIQHGTKTENLEMENEYFKKVWDGGAPQKSKIKARFDSDEDRLIIDRRGKTVRGDIIGGIIGEMVARKGQIILYDPSCSVSIPKYFRSKGVLTLPCKIGHYNFNKMMREKNASFGIEMSGHYYFRRFNFCESPHYALRLLNERVASSEGKKIDELTEPFTKLFHSGVLEIKTKDNSDFVKISTALKNFYRFGAQNNLDGLTIEFSNWWFNIRPSNTEPLLRLAVEARDKNIMEENIKAIKKIVSQT